MGKNKFSYDKAFPFFKSVNNQSVALKRLLMITLLFPDSSVGKESACYAGDPGSIPGSGKSPGEGIGYPPQYSWASLVAQLVKTLPAMWEVWSLGWKEPLEKGQATHSSILAWRIPWTAWSMGLQRVRHDLMTFTFILYWTYSFIRYSLRKHCLAPSVSGTSLLVGATIVKKTKPPQAPCHIILSLYVYFLSPQDVPAR